LPLLEANRPWFPAVRPRAAGCRLGTLPRAPRRKRASGLGGFSLPSVARSRGRSVRDSLDVARLARSERRSRQCWIGRPVAAAASDRRERTEQNALNRGGRLAEDKDVGELRRGERELQR